MTNGSLAGLSKSAIRRIENLKEDKMTQMFALAGSMSLQSKGTAETNEKDVIPDPRASSKELRRERIARELQNFIADGGKQAWVNQETSQSQSVESTKTPPAERDSSAPRTLIGPMQPDWIGEGSGPAPNVMDTTVRFIPKMIQCTT